MRKIIIKLWFGVYKVNIFKRIEYVERSAVANFLLFLPPAIMVGFGILENINIYLALTSFCIIAFCNFIYLKNKPVKWDELSDIQKWYYGSYYVLKIDKANWPEDFAKNKKQWNNLNKIYSK